MVKASGMRDARKARHMTQKELAKASDISFVSVCLYETGQRTPSVPVAKKCAAVLGVDWTRFYEEEDEDGKALLR